MVLFTSSEHCTFLSLQCSLRSFLNRLCTVVLYERTLAFSESESVSLLASASASASSSAPVADVLGARVYANADKEIGWFPVEKTEAVSGDGLFEAFPRQIDVFHWHGDTYDIPTGAVRAARSAGCANQAFVYDGRVVGLQFHLETTLDSAQQLIAHGANELVQGRYIQMPREILADASRFDAINRVMHDLLDRLATNSPKRIAPAGGETR